MRPGAGSVGWDAPNRVPTPFELMNAQGPLPIPSAMDVIEALPSTDEEALAMGYDVDRIVDEQPAQDVFVMWDEAAQQHVQFPRPTPEMFDEYMERLERAERETELESLRVNAPAEPEPALQHTDPTRVGECHCEWCRPGVRKPETSDLSLHVRVVEMLRMIQDPREDPSFDAIEQLRRECVMAGWLSGLPSGRPLGGLEPPSPTVVQRLVDFLRRVNDGRPYTKSEADKLRIDLIFATGQGGKAEIV